MRNLGTPGRYGSLSLANQNKIIAVSDVTQGLYAMHDEPVQLIEIDVGQDLTRQVANRHTSAAQGRLSLSLSTRPWQPETGNHVLQQRQCARVMYSANEQLVHHVLIDRIEKFLNVGSPDKSAWVCSEASVRTLDGTDQTFSFATRPGIKGKRWVKDRYQIFVQ